MGETRTADHTGTNNQANKAYVTDHPEDDNAPYSNVSSDVAIQTAKPKILEEVMNLPVGGVEGNRKLSRSCCTPELARNS
jgi:hypothetical protein